jgi:hypothetical protein
MSSVDVVIPCYNYGHFLKQCVESALSQPVDVRVLVIDDCSPDNTKEIGESLARQDSRVTFRRHEKNIGHIETYNEGLIGWAHADYSLLLSADDVIAPGALGRAAKILDRHPDASMAYGMGMVFSREVPREPIVEEPEYQIIPSDTFVRRCFQHVNPMETPTAVVRTSLQQKLGGYRKELPHTGDVEMWVRFAMQGPVVVINTVQAFVRRHETNMSRGFYGDRLRDCKQVSLAGDEMVRLWASQMPEMIELRRTLGSRVSVDGCWAAIRAYEAGDMKGYYEALEFAERENPNVRKLAVWWKAKARTALGPVWKAAQPLWRGVRGQKDRHIVSQRETGLAVQNERSGWWPESIASDTTRKAAV